MNERTNRERRVSRWDPFGDLDWPPLRDFFRSGALEPARGGIAMPAVEVSEDDDRYVVTAELAGVKKDDVTVEVHEGVLTLRGEKKSEREEKKEHSRYTERVFGSFSRSFSLPSNADVDQIETAFKDGVLSITIPKAEEAKPRVISIRSE